MQFDVELEKIVMRSTKFVHSEVPLEKGMCNALAELIECYIREAYKIGSKTSCKPS